MVNTSAHRQSSSSVFDSYSDELGFEFAADVAASAADIAFMVNNDLEILEVDDEFKVRRRFQKPFGAALGRCRLVCGAPVD